MIRLVFIIIFSLIALLAVFKAPTYHLWLLAISVTEYPLVFAAIAALLTFCGICVTHYRTTGTIIGILSVILYLSPVVRALLVANDLKANIAKAFGPVARFPSRTVFSFTDLFRSAKNTGFKTITYVTYGHTRLSLDFYASSTPGNRPCVIVVHGGSWSSGDSQQLPELNTYLAGKGYNIASINYRMAPKWQTPSPVEDLRNALAYLRKHADELQIDTGKFVLLGRSAGSQIALLAAYTLHDPGVRGVVDFYGPADMVWGYSIPSNPLIMDSRAVMHNYIGGTYKQVPAKYVACSPVEFVNNMAVPTLMIHGDNDVLVSPEHSRRLNLKLQKYRIPHYWLTLPWATHGFDFNLNGPGGQLSTYATETFLNTITQNSTRNGY